MRTNRLALSMMLFTVAGCADLDRGADLPTISVPPEIPSETSVRFSLTPGETPRWGDVPFPSDLYRDENGRIVIDGFPNPGADSPRFDGLWQMLSNRSGFCTTCAITFVVDGSLDRRSLATGLALVPLDRTGHGEVPLRFEYDEPAGHLKIRPDHGYVLAPATRYAAVLTRDVRGADGRRLAPSPDLRAVRDGELDVPLYAEALVDLAATGFSPGEVAGLAVFTTDEPDRELRAVREQIVAGGPATAVLDRIWIGDEIDALLGTPADGRPGLDRPVAAGTEGTVAVRHTTTEFVITGTFPAPRFVEGSGTEIGALHRRGDGVPAVASTEDVPFVLVIPRDADLANLPVAVAHHGFSASRTVAFVHADTLGEAGWAVLAIDAYQHGSRAASATDWVFAMRGELPGADGFSETNQLDITMRTFGMLGVPSERSLGVEYPVAAFTQFVADAISALRFVREGDIHALRAAHAGLAELSFDRERSLFIGNSMGAVVGTGVIAVEPLLDTAILNVMPGSIVATLTESGEFRPLLQRVFLPVLDVHGTFDEVERTMELDLAIDLYRWGMEPIDPLALAPRLAASPTEVFVQLATHDEIASPRASNDVVKVAAPASVTQYDAMHGMLEVSAQESRYEKPLIPPLVHRDERVLIQNPIDAVHEEIHAIVSDL